MNPLTAPFDALVSFHYFGSGPAEQVIGEMAAAGCRTIGDSGAYSAMSLGKPVNIDEFAEWGERHRKHLCWLASLDAIGDPERSWQNYRYLTRNGLSVVPTVHFGADGKTLDRYVNAGEDFIGLGGVAARKDRAAVLRWLVSMFRHARDNYPHVRFHGWGLTSRTYLAHLPFYSVDSSVFSASYRYGEVRVWHPEEAQLVQFRLDQRSAAQHWRLLRRHYGANAQDFATSGSHNRGLHVHLTSLSAQHMGRYYTRRHQVTPPRSQTPDGTRVHWVDAAPPHLRFALAVLGTRVHVAEGDVNAFKQIIRAHSPAQDTTTTEV